MMEKQNLSIATVIFIRSENNLALLWLYVLLGTSEQMLWIQSMLRVTSGNRGLTINCNCLGYSDGVTSKPYSCQSVYGTFW